MSKTGAGVENLRTYGRTKKVIDQSAIKFTDLLNLQPKEKKEASTANTKPATSDPTTSTGTSRSRRVAAVTAAANLKQPKTVNPKATSKRKSIENDSSKESNSNSHTNNNLASAAAAVVDLKLFQSSSTSSSTSSTSHHSEQHESIDLRKKRISESATATAIVNSNSMSIDMEATSLSTTNSAPKLKSIVKPPQQPVETIEAQQPQQPTTTAAAMATANAMGRPKRVVRILEELDVKKDRILENVKPDNKQKHTASTSTPSGGRRKPLKAPQDVSLIVRSETAANQSK